ncbi:hypothetical protein [Streptomyces sp. NRRL F-2664]|uniref:hypothetical protein n=1 Tax=Streptomyces sp. NRRL F-2664 TaxID=1463842 RepID=UPI0005BDE1B2|nr:hypothetical protein [Streptomyces sp. NRRL F-2664]
MNTQTSHTVVRPYLPRDRERLLELIEGDRLPGRPAVTADMLGHVLASCCPGDAVPSLLQKPRTDVAVGSAGEVVGAIGWALSEHGGDGLLLWLHCAEDDQHVAQVLVRHMLEHAGRRTVHALATPTAMSFAGLPVHNRRGSALALEAAGFRRQDGWSYLRCLPGTIPRLPYGAADITESTGPHGWYMRLRTGSGTPFGRAVVSRPVDGTAVLEWITLDSEHGSGHLHLRHCLARLADLGIRELTVLLDIPAGCACDSTGPAAQLHRQAGFQEIDQLHPYTRRL